MNLSDVGKNSVEGIGRAAGGWIRDREVGLKGQQVGVAGNWAGAAVMQSSFTTKDAKRTE